MYRDGGMARALRVDVAGYGRFLDTLHNAGYDVERKQGSLGGRGSTASQLTCRELAPKNAAGKVPVP